MINQIVKIHNASQISSLYIDIGIIVGIISCLIGLIFVIYASKLNR